MHQGGASILVCSPDLSVEDFLESDAGFVWVEVVGVRVYSCHFYPNDPFKVFETQILLLKESLSEAVGQCLIWGEFNSNSPEWDEACLHRRGILVGEMVVRNDLIVSNQGKEFTFRRGSGGGSIIDLTIAATCLASTIGDWGVLKVIVLSDHRSIELNLEQRYHAENKGRGGEGRSPSRNKRRLQGETKEYISRQPGSLMSLVGSGLLGRWKTLCIQRGERWSQLATVRCLAASTGKPRIQCTGGTTSWRPYVENASQCGENSPA